MPLYSIGPTEAARLRAAGVALSGQIKQLQSISRIEPPCVINAALGPSHYIGMGSFTYSQGGEVNFTDFGRYCSVATGVSIGQASHPSTWLSSSPFQYRPDPWGWAQYGVERGICASAPTRPITYDSGRLTTIGNDVWIGTRAIIMQGVSVGDGAIIGAGAVVTKDVPPYAIVTGVPAVVRRYRFAPDVIERLLRFRWWRYALWDLRDLPFDDPALTLDLLAERQEAGAIAEWKPELVPLGTPAG